LKEIFRVSLIRVTVIGLKESLAVFRVVDITKLRDVRMIEKADVENCDSE
jgi:hypothetical protein